jgi:hypothetical protein
MPGVYREEPSRAVPMNDPKCSTDDQRYWEETGDGHGENGKVPTYRFHVECKNSRNLVQITGDSLDDPDRVCDQRCRLQIEGKGRRPRDVVIEGDRIKRDVLRADRADGIVIRNLTTEQASFNGIDVVETNGFRVQDVVSRWNQNYGVLTFTTDNGLYNRVQGYGNGDSAIYPGSGPEGHCRRYGIEVRNSSGWGNVLGVSGTAGNGTWYHHNRFYNNSVGVVNDSFVPGHPGMPQDCSKWTENRIYSNNANFFVTENQEFCRRTPFKDRPRAHVCPQFQAPVGSGIALYGANDNIVENNYIYDNWRSGFRLFWVPAAVRGENDPTKQADTSNGNAVRDNVFGVTPDGRAAPNGVDVYWDEQGVGNCWDGNRGTNGGPITSDPATLPSCPNRGGLPSSNLTKLLPEAPCATWDPQDNPDPPGCTWFDTPANPRKR